MEDVNECQRAWEVIMKISDCCSGNLSMSRYLQKDPDVKQKVIIPVALNYY